MATSKIKLQSSDGDTFDVEVEIAKQSITIKTMLEGNRHAFYLIKINFNFKRSWNEGWRWGYSITKC